MKDWLLEQEGRWYGAQAPAWRLVLAATIGTLLIIGPLVLLANWIG